MSTKSIAIAYSAENEEVAKAIEQQLSPAGYNFQRYACTRSTSDTPLADQLLDQPNRILLIISDNFLKSAQCMSRGLKLIQEKRNQILPVVVDGISKDENTGETIKIHTDFERVSDIIQYINYWQDQYLDLRRQKRQMQDFDEEAFNNHLKIMREISSEVGEFLRVLRVTDYLPYQEFAANRFEGFFNFTRDPEGHQRLKNQPATPPEAEPVSPETEEEKGEPVTEKEFGAPEEPSAETKTQEEETPEAGLEEIPGIGSVIDTEEQDMRTEPPLPEAATGPAEETEGQAESEEEASEEEYVEEFYLDEEEDDELEGREKDTEEDIEEEEIITSPEAQTAVIVEEAMDYFNTGQTQEGLAFMAQAVEENPDNPYLRYHYALMLAQKAHNYAKAQRELEPVVEMQAENEDALFLLGELEELQEDFESAHKHYAQLVDLNPEYPNAYYRLGMITAAHFEDDKKKAAKYFKKAARMDEENADAHYQYALLLTEVLDKPKKAIKYFEKTLEIDPRHPFANYDLALLYHQLGKPSKARNAYLSAVEANPELKTEENDRAFLETAPPEAPASAPGKAGIGHDTLEALKQNIFRLEELLQEKEEQAQQLQQELEEAPEPEPEKPQAGQTVLITGATSGIGRATAEIFARNGYRVILTGRRAERLEEVKGQFEKDHDADVLALSFDVRDRGAVEHLMRQLSEQLGDTWKNIDILINNAGKAKGLAPIHEGDIEHWEEMIDTNLKGLLYMTRAISPGMVERQSGHIINICSTAGKEVYPDGNVYCATKFAVDALTKAMRMDLHKHNVRVSMVSPAHVDETEFALVRFDGDEERAKIYEDFKPLSSEDVAEAIFFMATRPAHVNVLDIVMQGTQQAHSMIIDRSGRERYEQ